MRIHAIQTGTVAVKERQRVGTGKGPIRMLNTMLSKEWTEPLPIYAWVIEHPEGVIVVDTGETARAKDPGYFPPHPYYRLAVREWVTPEQEIGPQLRAIGISPNDVRWVVMTHLHTDHHGGLHHFPNSEILVSRTEWQQATGFLSKLKGYLPHRYPEWLNPTLVDYHKQQVGTFPDSFQLTKAGDVRIVPTPGHSPGHQSVILQHGGLSYLFAGDTSYTEDAMLKQQLDGITTDLNGSRTTLTRTLEYVRQIPTIYLPSHDPASAERLANRTFTRPGPGDTRATA